MSFIRYKKFGNKEYAYEVTSYWDPEKKKPRQKTKYLGVVVDKEKKIFKKKSRERREKLILDFGDTYFLNQFINRVTFFENLKKEMFLALIFYRLCYPSAMRYARMWYEGNIVRKFFDVDISSQRISEFLEEIGDESIQREFFKEYIRQITPSEGIVIDTTALPNQINIPRSSWGWHNEEIDKQIKLLLVIDRSTSLPLFFRYIAGNIVDVSTLKATVEELKKYGVSRYFLILDAGFFSEENIKELYNEEIQFLIRLPALRKLYKRPILEESRELESYRNAVRYGRRVLFVKQREVELFGKRVYAYVVLDPERKGREIRRTLLKVMDEIEEDEEEEMEYILMKKGIMILISSSEPDRENVISLYYTRQIAEKLFGFPKDDLNLLPLRVHKEETLRGYLFLQFASLVVYSLLKRELGRDYTVEEVLLTLRNLKCKVYEDEIIVQELTKQQRKIFEKFSIMVPKSMGI
ncbi:Transposase DDE domain protein [Candidatus Methanoperedenaceae archaeon GB37]|nr:Transposase DDE domain protein [Candidatus Methanoperedenaceae archaeon GB37]CAD7772685.1 Transposase DDE domain protein [Candidatus Methanoperedenaceae archaeon GB37]